MNNETADNDRRPLDTALDMVADLHHQMNEIRLEHAALQARVVASQVTILKLQSLVINLSRVIFLMEETCESACTCEHRHNPFRTIQDRIGALPALDQ